MKKLFFLTTFIFGLSLPTSSFAEGMMGNNMMNGSNTITQIDDGLPAEASAQAGHTAREEAEGKEIWEKLSARGGSASGGQAEQITCTDLTDDDFGALGEYFMGQMAGEQHEAMNNMMTRMMGEEGEEQMHIAMGKRMSGCEPNAPMPQNMMNPVRNSESSQREISNGMNNGMMQMMMGGYPFLKGGDSNMMGNFATYGPGSFFGFFGMLVMFIFWILVIVAIVALIRWLMVQGQGSGRGNSALEILKERYAKGEIDKKEFEEKKKDIGS